jgi:hypothetical protein
MAVCLACSHDSGELIGRGVLAPFIAELFEEEWLPVVDYYECAECGFCWYSRRFTEAEVGILYSGYREGAYLKSRKKYEPWYTSRVNDAYTGGTASIDTRVLFMSELLAPHIGTATLAVDIGGDEGQFFPNMDIDRRYVVDISSKKLRPGVQRITQISDLGGLEINLLIAAHILEHVSEPLEFLQALAVELLPGAILYLEVPLDAPAIAQGFSMTRNEKLVATALKSKLFTIFIDFLTGLRRNFGIPLNSFSLLKESEHINYFNEKSLEMIVRRAGFEVLEIDTNDEAKTGNFRLGKMGLVARKAMV